MTTRSMTGFASREGAGHGWTWSWDIRGVNGRSLDLRLRLPDHPEGLEPAVRAAVQKAVKRGNITISLKLTRDDTATVGALNPATLAQTIAAIGSIEAAARSAQITLNGTSAAEILAIRGVMDTTAPDDDTEALRAALMADIDPLVADFDAARAGEGQSLHTILTGQIDEIDRLVAATGEVLQARSDHIAAQFRAALERVMETSDAVSEDRLAQELATLAVKADITEEVDRLGAHVTAARTLLAEDGPKGRKLDFLIQEFNREANTICSKAQFAELTRVGLDLKHTIDQMREQIQNVE